MRKSLGHSLSLKTACGLFGHCRQAFYQHVDTSAKALFINTEILPAVQAIREMDPGIGALKLYYMLCGILDRDRMPSRDAFYGLLRKHHLMLPPERTRHTTNSNHRYRTYKNLSKGFIPDSINQLWVSDITYIDTEAGSVYLHLVTDAYSHQIIGWNVASSLKAIHTLAALEMALGAGEKTNYKDLIHHSDRGSQYCCDLYINKLKQYAIRISMTEDSNPTDNAIAERINGIIKQEYVYRVPRFKDQNDACEQLGAFIHFYNTQRPHLSLNLLSPEKVTSMQGPIDRKWKRKVYKYEKSTQNTNL